MYYIISEHIYAHLGSIHNTTNNANEYGKLNDVSKPDGDGELKERNGLTEEASTAGEGSSASTFTTRTTRAVIVFRLHSVIRHGHILYTHPSIWIWLYMYVMPGICAPCAMVLRSVECPNPFSKNVSGLDEGRGRDEWYELHSSEGDGARQKGGEQKSGVESRWEGGGGAVQNGKCWKQTNRYAGRDTREIKKCRRRKREAMNMKQRK